MQKWKLERGNKHSWLGEVLLGGEGSHSIVASPKKKMLKQLLERWRKKWEIYMLRLIRLLQPQVD